MAEGQRLADRARSAVARIQTYEGDLSRRETALAGRAEEYSHLEAGQKNFAERLERVRAGLRAEAERLKAQRGQQDGFEKDLEYFLDRLGAPTRLEGESFSDYTRRAAAEVLQKKETQGQQARVLYEKKVGAPDVLGDAVRESLGSGHEQKADAPVLKVQRKFSPKNLGPDSVKIDYAQDGGRILVTVDVKKPSDLGYYERALQIVTVPFAYPQIEKERGRMVILGKPDAVENFFRQLENRVQSARTSSEIDDALEKLAQ